MKDTAPTMDEINEVNRLNEQLSYKELHDMKFYDDSRNMTIIKNMTVQLMKHASDDNRKKYGNCAKSYLLIPMLLLLAKNTKEWNYTPRIRT